MTARRSILITAAVCSVCMLFAACSLPSNKTNTSLTLTETGAVTETIIEDTEDGSFDAEELQAFIEEEADVFNRERETEEITLDSCKVENGSVNLTITYASPDVYSAFNQVTCFAGTLKEAEDAGFSLDRAWIDPGGNEGEHDIIMERAKEWKIFIVSEPFNVKVPDKILYTSDNVNVTGRQSATVETVMADTAPDGTSEESAGAAGENSTSAAGDGGGDADSGDDQGRKVHPLATVVERFAYIIYK